MKNKSETKTITIKQSSLDILHNRLCMRYRELDFGLYCMLINEVTNVLRGIHEDMQDALVKTDFLIPEKS